MNNLKKLEEEVSTWPNVSVHPHRFGGKEFRCGRAEVGHVHIGGIVDIPFPRSIHDVLLSGLAEEHRWVPNSGWITFRIRDEQDLNHALWLMRLSYLRYALKRASDPHGMLEQEVEKLRLTPRFRSLLERHLSAKASQRSPRITDGVNAQDREGTFVSGAKRKRQDSNNESGRFR